MKIELTEKEVYIIWSIICWFNSPVTSTMKYKLSGMHDSPKRKKMEKLYDKKIMKQIVELGKNIERHPEWIEEK